MVFRQRKVGFHIMHCLYNIGYVRLHIYYVLCRNSRPLRDVVCTEHTVKEMKKINVTKINIILDNLLFSRYVDKLLRCLA